MYVFRPLQLTDSTPHRERFDLALARNRNIAFIAYASYRGRSLVALETVGIDPPYTEEIESGCHNYQFLESPLRLIAVESAFRWFFGRLYVRNNRPNWNCIGWPE